MASLVDYDSSSSSDSDEEIESDRSPQEFKPSASKLPKPAFDVAQTSAHNSVFSNPFVEAELAKAAVLEKHVKMVPGKEQTQMINGKKICWSFRKGRCRFGHNCKFAHDTDIQKSSEELEEEKQARNVVISEESGTNSLKPPPPVELNDIDPTCDEVWESKIHKNKLKRPGLSKGLVPGKKVLKLYKEQKLQSTKKK